jgi:hypothetical protein
MIGITGFAFYRVKVGVNYQFLRGHSPVQVTQIDGGLLQDVVYTFPGNQNSVALQAEAELGQAGYLRSDVDPWVTFRKMPHDSFTPTIYVSSGNHPPEARLGFIQWNYLPAPDWATVEVVREDPVPLWLRNWIGYPSWL